MRFRMTVLLLTTATVLAGVKFLPTMLAHIHHNSEIREMVKHLTRSFMTSDAASGRLKTPATVITRTVQLQIAESKDCTPQGIMIKRKFKNLV